MTGKATARSGRLQELLADRDNNFDVLRLAAAAMVLVGHSFFLAGQSDPVLPVTGAELSVVGLLLFFAISGFLVTRSWLNEPRVLSFTVKRGLRIMPALVVALVVTAYIIGPLTSSTDTSDYLRQSAPGEYVVGRSLMLTDKAVHQRLTRRVAETPGDSLPGVFESNPEENVNGSLWTLPIEVTAYALVALAGLLALFWRLWPARIAAAAVLVGASAAALWTGGSTTYSLLATFAGGALLYLLRRRLALNVWLFVLALGVWVASYQLPPIPEAVLTGLSLPYAVVFLAFRGLDGLRWLARPGDVSYGIYIYAWPVQQLVIHATGTRSPAVVLVLSGVATYAVALASWRLVERPALRLKGRLSHPSVRRTGIASEPDLLVEGASTGR
jgi:peptidoglycan/LPS O-acetylase OafA/YrhL